MKKEEEALSNISGLRQSGFLFLLTSIKNGQE